MSLCLLLVLLLLLLYCDCYCCCFVMVVVRSAQLLCHRIPKYTLHNYKSLHANGVCTSYRCHTHKFMHNKVVFKSTSHHNIHKTVIMIVIVIQLLVHNQQYAYPYHTISICCGNTLSTNPIPNNKICISKPCNIHLL